VKLVEKGSLARLRLERAGALDAFLAQVALRLVLDLRRRREVAPCAAQMRHPSADPEAEATPRCGGSSGAPGGTSAS